MHAHAHEDHRQRRLAMLFSGGMDTTLEVVERSEEYDGFDLLTFDNGHCIHLEGARRRVRELREFLGADRIRHVEILTVDLIQLLLEDSTELWREFRSPLIFDMACKLSSVTELMFHAKVNGIDDLCDGASMEQTEIFLQRVEFAEEVKRFVEDYDLSFLHPARYDWTREQKQQRLVEKGFRPGLPALEKLHIGGHLAHQPFCLRGIVTYFFTSPLRHLSVIRRYELPMDQAIALWRRLLPIARAYLDRRLSHVALG